MSSAVQDRVDREHVTPWFKFLWETYRTVLDILRNNARLEALYAMTAARAFQFCLTYKRTTEFRRLCDILRNHLANLNKYGITVAHNPAEMHAQVQPLHTAALARHKCDTVPAYQEPFKVMAAAAV